MRAKRKSLRVGWVAAGVLVAAVSVGACSGTPETSSVEIMHWWKQGGEAQAIDALLADFKRQNPSVKIIDSSVDGSSLARAAIRNRMSRMTPPDTFQANGGWDLMAWVLFDGTDADQTKMQELDPVALDLAGNVQQQVLDTVSYNGKVYGVPLNIHRLNVLFYNKAVFQMLGIDASQLASLDDLFAAADKVVQHNQQQLASDPNARQITPIALGYRATEGEMATDDTWTLSLVFFENIIVARMGGTPYQNLFAHPRADDAFTPAMTNVLADFRRLVSYANVDAPSLTWSQPLDMVLSGEAAMTIMGDWGKGYLKSKPHSDDAFGVIPTPGTAGTFVFTTDTFGLPIGALDAENTHKLLSVFASREGQDVFNPFKGSISARQDSHIYDDAYDAISKQMFADFNDPATLRVPATSILAPQSYVDAISGALADFAAARDNANPSIVQHTLVDYSDVLRSSCWPACQSF